MASCFLTGVQFPEEKGYVLNRRAAREFLAALNVRVAGLQRLIEQFGALDNDTAPRPFNAEKKRHRLVCLAVADALAAGFPEAKLFIRWPEHYAQSRLTIVLGMRHHPLISMTLPNQDEATLMRLGSLAKQVLTLLDPSRHLPPEVRVEIAVNTCVLHTNSRPKLIMKAIRQAVATRDPQTLNISMEALTAIGRLPCIAANTDSGAES